MSKDELKREALKLPSHERVEFAYELLRVTDEEDEPEEGYERLWQAEIDRRCQEIDEGTAELIPAEEVFAELRARLK
jgi:putative addiction module component (TIGR02574 family)